ncbi:M48 family metalloprotease [Actinoplanes awajinensis]|uniref:Peptidase M48 domain-containing protein n=1 Tax=Actinoplanes awajinensis subsp. mycoplanecinus TaxID=135947 RepID=A0A0X3V9X2_9ACTN|nr:M48 family metalloprotease [Actinoplanes awajinensis]KUL41364.1 hypothetical protein ADL15_03675 [Actinoplanes awajinensis subsp. mycoplanecinus]
MTPFTLPPATGGRFGLLVLATVTSSCYLYSWLAGHLTPIADAGRYCAEQAREDAPHVLPDALSQWYTGCSDWAGLREAAAVAVLLTVLLLGVLAQYLIAPRWTRRGLTRLDDASWVRKDLAAAGVPASVSAFVDSAGPRATRAFGNRLEYSIVIGSTDYTDACGPAVLAHEIGHLQNRDLDATALTTAVWRAFLVLAAAPTLLVALTDPAGLRYYGWRLASLLLLVYVLRCQVIRTREFYADHRAVGPHRPAKEFLDALARRGDPTSLWNQRFHPGRKQRDSVLQDSGALFRLSAATAAAAGMLVGLAYRPGYHFVSILWPSSVFGKDLLCGVLFGGLAAAALAGATWRSALWTVTVESSRTTWRSVLWPVTSDGPSRATWRSVLRSIASDDVSPRAALAAVTFTAGLLAGDLIAPAQPGAAAWAPTMLRSPGPGLAVALVLAAGTWLFLRWTFTTAAPRLASTLHPRPGYHRGMVVAVLVAGVWLGFWFRIAEVFQLDPHWRAVVFGLATAAVQPVPLLVVWLAGLYTAAVVASRTSGIVAGDLRTPWRLVHLVAGGVVVAYTLLLAADHTAIAAAIGRAQVDGTPAALWPLSYLLYAPALLTALAGGLVAGLAYASRQRTGQLLAGVVTVLPALAGSLFLVSLAAVVLLDGLDRSFVTLLTGLGGLPGREATDQPRFAALGVMILALYAALLIGVVPLAWLGARIRRRWRRAHTDDASLPSRRRVVAGLLPGALAGVIIAVLGLREWSFAVTTADLRLDYDTTAVQLVQDRARPGSLSGGDACRSLYAGGTSFGYGPQTDAGAAGQLAALAAIGMSADDLVMQRLGRAAMDGFTLRQLATGTAAVSNLLRYCLTTTPAGPGSPPI